ncbi:hypothetical protein G7Y89_g5950 [Cudoniella acicularis]|uniref:Uncharacterized protein n=1 Tax=Cudoniella acicularis TaxID=354080 RepID=A0A8H4RNQ3_9HELO|nr:hypothetical protein G7Y89_g5950 [Cudoniella acicularis]
MELKFVDEIKLATESLDYRKLQLSKIIEDNEGTTLLLSQGIGAFHDRKFMDSAEWFLRSWRQFSDSLIGYQYVRFPTTTEKSYYRSAIAWDIVTLRTYQDVCIYALHDAAMAYFLSLEEHTIRGTSSWPETGVQVMRKSPIMQNREPIPIGTPVKNIVRITDPLGELLSSIASAGYCAITTHNLEMEMVQSNLAWIIVHTTLNEEWLNAAGVDTLRKAWIQSNINEGQRSPNESKTIHKDPIWAEDLAMSDLIHINASLATFENMIRKNYDREVDERLESRADHVELNTLELRNRHARYKAIGGLDYELPDIIQHKTMTTRKKIEEYEKAEKPYYANKCLLEYCIKVRSEGLEPKAQPSTSLRMEDVSSHFKTMPHASYEIPSSNPMFDPQNNKKIMAVFRSQAEIRGNCCAITGIRGFASYDLILQTAHLKKAYPPDRMALRHHWDMCVIENMAAEEPLQISSSTLGTVTEPLSQNISRGDQGDSPGNDFDSGPPSKRKKSNGQQDDPRQHNLSPTGQLQCDDVGVECSFACLGSTDVATTPALSTPATDSSRKRRYSDKSPVVESSEVLLSEVNWELRKYKRSRQLQ